MPEPPPPWLLGVARNVLRDRYREEARRAAFTASFIEGRAPKRVGAAEGDVADRVAERLAMLRAVAALPGGDREGLILVAWQGLAPKDAATVVGCGATAMRVRLHRARKRLMRALGDGPVPDGRTAARASAPTAAPATSADGGEPTGAPARARVRMISEESS